MSWELIYIISGILILPVFIIAIVVSISVQNAMSKYKRMGSRSGMTASELVKKIADQEGLTIKVQQASNFMGDHYDPKDKAVRLTKDVINSSSVTALAIAAHECGHAIQDKNNYMPLKIRQIIIRISNFSSRLLLPLIIIGAIASVFLTATAGLDFMKWLMIGFCAVYGLSALANFITLPTEFDASNRAKKLLNSMNVITEQEEKDGVNKVLRAAANTYVVAFAMSLLYFLRFLAFVVLAFGKEK